MPAAAVHLAVAEDDVGVQEALAVVGAGDVSRQRQDLERALQDLLQVLTQLRVPKRDLGFLDGADAGEPAGVDLALVDDGGGARDDILAGLRLQEQRTIGKLFRFHQSPSALRTRTGSVEKAA